MKNDLWKLLRWVCRKLTYNDLASVVPVLLEVLNGSRQDIELKPQEVRPPHYRQFRVNPTPPLCEPLQASEPKKDWEEMQADHFRATGKTIAIVKRKKGAPTPPEKCRCQHCNAPVRYLYLNNGKLGSQVKCKICKGTSPTDKPRRENKARYWCPHCGYALFKWKEDGLCTAFKCPNDHCPVYVRNLGELTPEECAMRKAGNTSQFKLRYLFREYHFASEKLPLKRPEDAPVDLNRIHHSLHTLGLCLTFSISLGLSARLTAQALERVFDIRISHQTVINYIKAAACQLSDFTDENSPVPEGTCAADETYIKVSGKTRYTWLVITETRRAICGYNLSETRGAEPALGLIQSMCGPPDAPKAKAFELVTDGLPSYDSATIAYNTAAIKEGGEAILNKRTVIGLKNLDSESETYRVYKQLIERLNRTYKYHTRPRAGFKGFDGATALTTLFVTYYNFMRPHGSLGGHAPVALACLKGKRLYPDMWVELLRQAA